MSMLEQQAEELVAEYERRRAKSGELRRQIGEIRGTATSARGAIKVTVNVQGEVTEIEFPTGAYKRMPPRELSGALLATIGEAKEKALDALRELMTPEMPTGLSVKALLQGTEALQAPTMADIPDFVREHLGDSPVTSERRSS